MNLHQDMLSAIMKGNLSEIKKISKMDPDFINEDSHVFLSMACLYNQFAVAQYFIKEGADINYDDNHYIRDIIRNENLEMLKYFVNKGSEIHAPNKVLLYNPLILASSIGNLEIVHYLVEDIGVDIHQLNDLALKAAVSDINITSQHHEVIRYLVHCGIDINMENGFSLHKAVIKNDMDMVQFFIEQGANVNANDTMCLQTASFSKNFAMVKYLVENGANVNATEGWSLQVSARDGNENIVKYLVANGADIHLRDDYALKCAFDSLYNGRQLKPNPSIDNIIQFLISQGANIHFEHEYCLHICGKFNHKDMAAYLLDNGALPHFISNNNEINPDMEKWINTYYFENVQTPFFEKMKHDLNKVESSSSKKVKI